MPVHLQFTFNQQKSKLSTIPFRQAAGTLKPFKIIIDKNIVTASCLIFASEVRVWCNSRYALAMLKLETRLSVNSIDKGNK